MSPQRVQLHRTKGWKMPENTVIVDRRSRWGNPYRVGEMHPETWEERTAEEAVDLFVRSIKHWWPDEYLPDAINELRGKNLGCWCPIGAPCHADVLLALVNGDVSHDDLSRPTPPDTNDAVGPDATGDR